MQALDPAAELAPRDVVARGIAHTMAAQDGQPVMLDATALGESFLHTRFPTIDAACRARGLDWSRTPIPVTPAAHYWMGGIRTDTDGRTTLAGLYAVGECACTGVHGANRLASNSLLESLVFAWRCAQLLLSGETAHAASFPAGSISAVTSADAHGESAESFHREQLQTLMWEQAGIERDAQRLREAASKLAGWNAATESVHDLENANLLTIARVLVQAALAREESRGAHDRTDFPERSEAFAHSLVYVYAQPVSAQSLPAHELEAARC